MNEGLMIRILFQTGSTLEDRNEDYPVEHFGGTLPSPGDWILKPAVAAGADRRDPENRRIWEVIRRVYNPKDLAGEYVALVVKERLAKSADLELLP